MAVMSLLVLLCAALAPSALGRKQPAELTAAELAQPSVFATVITPDATYQPLMYARLKL